MEREVGRVAKVGGRSSWIAWPTALICVGVIGVLLWLAAPGVPAAVSFVGDTLRGASSAPRADTAGAADVEPPTECRGLYPDGLWATLTWTPDVLLTPSTAAPATSPALTQALAPEVRFTCTWTAAPDLSVVTTLATVPEGAVAIAQATLSSEGFSCEPVGERTRCQRTSGSTLEVHDLQGTDWLATLQTNWLPEGYAEKTAARVFPR